MTAAALLLLAAGQAASAPPPRAGEVPGAVLVLEATPGSPGSDPAGAPPRFVLLKDGSVYVGGTRHLEAGRLEKGEASALRKRADQARKLPGLAPPVAFGGEGWMRLRLPEDDVEIVATGDPAAAPSSLAPLASLLSELLAFHHPSLRPYAPQSYAVSVREARVPGGCRPWSFAFPLAEALAGPRAVGALEASGWPTGAVAASVCLDEARPSVAPARRYAVTLRPLLPGERP